jgi:hypothetical protein
MSNRLVFDELITASATELFGSRGIPLQAYGDRDASIEYAATIGFSAHELSGMLGLGMSPATLERLTALDQEGDAAGLEDWLGEAVNQLLGRLKNKLVPYGVIVSLAVPNVLRGMSLQFHARRSSPLWMYSFDSEAGIVCVWLDVRMNDGVELAVSADPDQRAAPEGDLVLF